MSAEFSLLPQEDQSFAILFQAVRTDPPMSICPASVLIPSMSSVHQQAVPSDNQLESDQAPRLYDSIASVLKLYSVPDGEGDRRVDLQDLRQRHFDMFETFHGVPPCGDWHEVQSLCKDTILYFIKSGVLINGQTNTAIVQRSKGDSSLQEFVSLGT